MVVLSVADYQRITSAIRAFQGLWIECDKVIREQFPNIDPVSISSICAREGQNRLRQQHSTVSRDIRRILREYESQAKRHGEKICDEILLKLAQDMKFSPISL